MRLLSLSLAALALSATTAAAEFTISFDWGNIPACRTGKPNTVGSPAFVLRGVPAGTTSIEFSLKDRDAPNYNHGGGRLKVGSDGQLPFGAFKYKSPCPPRQAENIPNRYQRGGTINRAPKVICCAIWSR